MQTSSDTSKIQKELNNNASHPKETYPLPRLTLRAFGPQLERRLDEGKQRFALWELRSLPSVGRSAYHA